MRGRLHETAIQTQKHEIRIGNSMICADIWHNLNTSVIFWNCYM